MNTRSNPSYNIDQTKTHSIPKLISLAIKQMDYSYSPYSGFRVGTVLVTKTGKLYTGCNIENAAYTPTNCAERTAVFKAVSEGEKDFKQIIIVGGKNGIITDYCPCLLYTSYGRLAG